MAIDHTMLELLDEMVKPEEMHLANSVEDCIDLECDILFGDAELDDDVINFINKGSKLGYADPVDLSEK